jgi:hypothetical protein
MTHRHNPRRLRIPLRLRLAGLIRALPRLASMFAFAVIALALATGLAVASTPVAAGRTAAEPTTPPGVPDPGTRPSPNPAPSPPGATPSPVGPPPATTPPPDPVTPTPGPSPGPTPPGWNPPAEGSGGEPGLFDIGGQIRQAINDFFAWTVDGALDPVLSAVGEAVLTTPNLTADARVRTMWTTCLVVANSVFVLFVMAAAITVASRETLQTRYGLKQILPRLVVAAVLVNTSLPIAGKAIEVTNAVTAAIAGQGVDGHTTAAALAQALGEARQGNTFLLTLLVLGVLAMAVVVVFTFVLRIVFLAVLIGSAPLALICHASPHTEPLAFLWWRAGGACLGIQVCQAVVVLAALRMFLTPAGTGLLTGGTPSRLVSILVVAAVVWLLLKIPGWMRRLVLGPFGHGGRGLVGQIIHTIVMVKTLGVVTGLTRTGRVAAHRPAAARAGRSAIAGRAPRVLGTAPARPSGRPGASRLPRAGAHRTAGRKVGTARPAMFSHTPASHTPLPAPTGTPGAVTFSHPPTPPPRTPPSGPVPPVHFSTPSTPPASPRPRPTAAVRFSSTPTTVTVSPRSPGRPAAPAAAPVFSAAPRPQAAPKRPPTPASTPVFSTAPTPAPPVRRPRPSARAPIARTPPPTATSAGQPHIDAVPPTTSGQPRTRRRPLGRDS